MRVEDYNTRRPHQSLNMDTPRPGSVTPSPVVAVAAPNAGSGGPGPQRWGLGQLGYA